MHQKLDFSPTAAPSVTEMYLSGALVTVKAVLWWNTL